MPIFNRTKRILLLAGIIALLAPEYSHAQSATKPAQVTRPAQMTTIEGKVVERKKYSLVIDDGKRNHQVVIANVGQVALRLIRPKIDFERRSISVVTTGKTEAGKSAEKSARKTFKFQSPLFVSNRFAHQKQYDRFQSMPTKRLTDFVVSNTKPDTASNKFVIAGELKAGDKPREYQLHSGKQAMNVLLVADVSAGHGRMTNMQVTDIAAGDKVIIKAQRVDDRWMARSIEFQPSAASLPKSPNADASSSSTGAAGKLKNEAP